MTTAVRQLVDAEPVRQHLRALMAAGAPYARVAETAGVPLSTVNHMLYDRRTRGRTQRLTIPTATRLLAVQAHQVTAGRINPTGSVRRLEALMAIGWPPSHLGPRLGLNSHYACEIQRNPTIYATTAHNLAVVYNQLWNKNPEHYGVSAQAANRFRNFGRARGWAPPAAWDDDTIDDPDAQPDWTGHCGTDRGWYMHREVKQTPCLRCQNAHDQWIASIRHLPMGERARVMATTRADALSRGAAIAENARELFAQGYTRRHAAERLGISLDRIEAELARHPDKQQAAA